MKRRRKQAGHQGAFSFSGGKVATQIGHQNISGSVHNNYNFLSHVKRPRRSPNPESEQDWRRELIRDLEFPQSGERYLNIESPHIETCEWLLQRSEWTQWLDPTQLSHHHGLFWIKGNPGTGKSTLMKYILDEYKMDRKDDIILAFFFNARGVELERSTQGMYRTLLVQLLVQLPHLDLEVGHRTRKRSEIGEVDKGWSINQLKTIFEILLRQMSTKALAVFIDALDECDDDEVRDMVSFLERLGDIAISCNVSFRACLSSRHYPHITISRGLSFALETQIEHHYDIEIFIDSQLRVGNDCRAQRIRDELLRKSSGIFLWVRLVVPILNKEYDRGRVSGLEHLLHQIPAKVELLFEEILAQKDDPEASVESMHATELCFRWMLFSYRPLTLVELYLAIRTGTDESASPKWDTMEVDSAAMARFILHCSKGLVEATGSALQTVQLIHETVRTFLLSRLPTGGDASTRVMHSNAECHDRLKFQCFAYITKSLADVASSSSEAAAVQFILSLKLSSFQPYGFWDYATDHVLRHSNDAESIWYPQRTFLEQFPYEAFYSITEPSEKPCSLLGLLVECGLSKLVKCQLERVIAKESFYRFISDPSPLALPIREISTSELSVYERLLACGETQGSARSQAPSLAYHHAFDALTMLSEWSGSDWVSDWIYSSPELLEQCLFDKDQSTDGLDFAKAEILSIRCTNNLGLPLLRRNPVTRAMMTNCNDTAEILVEAGVVVDAATNAQIIESQPSCLTVHLQHLLASAASFGAGNVVSKLLELGVPVDNGIDECHTALIQAVENNHVNIVEMLLAAGASIDTYCSLHGTALAVACLAGYTDIVQILLQAGAKVDAHAGCLGTALIASARGAQLKIFEMLLEAGADISARGQAFGTVLQAAQLCSGPEAESISLHYIKNLRHRESTIQST